MKRLKYMAGAALVAMAISSCDEDTMTIGQSLTNQSDELELASQSFNVSTRTLVADSVFSLTASNFLGQIRDPETGTIVKSQFTTQFHLLESTYISPETKIVGRYNGRASADSCELVLYLSSPFKSKDSLTAMKMRVTEMATPMEEGFRYYSNYDPTAAGMLRVGGINKSKMFSYKNLAQTDSARSSKNYMENIRVMLNEPYTATNGTTYNNYGTYLIQQYYDHPEYFRNSYSFTHNLCPGFFFQIVDGLGFYAEVSNIGLRTYYTVQGDTAVKHAALTLAGTPEVLQTSHIYNDNAALKAMAQETDHTYLKTPAGLFTEVTLPVEQIKTGHETDSLIGANITFQKLNFQSMDDRMLGIPQRLLMVPKDSLKNFFESSKVPDNELSYYTTYESMTGTYTFNNVANLVTSLWEAYRRGVAADPSWTTKHPNWNKMVLVPVSYNTSSAMSTITNVQHDMSLTSIRLVGGSANPYDPIQIKVVYARFH